MSSFRRAFLALFVTLAFCQLTLAGTTKPSYKVSGRTNKEEYYRNSDVHPALVADSYTTHQNASAKCFNVLNNDYDAGTRAGFQLVASTLAIYKQPSSGLAYVQNQVACYKPDAGFFGEDIFSYTVCDSHQYCEWEEVKVYVHKTGDGPNCADDDVVLTADKEFVVIDVLENDQDRDGAYIDITSLQVVVPPCEGTAMVTPDNRIVYTPNDKEFYGTDHFTYQICDNSSPSLCGNAEVYIQIQERCSVCENCQDLLPTFNLQRDWIHSYYRSDVLSVANC